MPEEPSNVPFSLPVACIYLTFPLETAKYLHFCINTLQIDTHIVYFVIKYIFIKVYSHNAVINEKCYGESHGINLNPLYEVDFLNAFV